MRPLVKTLDMATEIHGPYALNWRGGDATVSLDVTGTFSVNIQGTNSDLQDGETATWFGLGDDLTGASASVSAGLYAVPRFVRVQRASGSSGTLILQISQADR